MKKSIAIFALFSMMVLTSFNEPVKNTNKISKTTTTLEVGGSKGSGSMDPGM